jgi:homocysteine S-methyltransferase
MAIGYRRETAQKLILKSIDLAEVAIKRALASGMIDFQPLIAASVGPYGAYLADGSEYHGHYGVSDETLSAFHQERIALLDGSNADILACETLPSAQEARVLSALLVHVSKPVWISFSCRDEQHLNDGTKIKDIVSTFSEHPKVFAIGVNCTDPQYISSLIKCIKPSTGNKKIIVYPNSGEAYNAESKTWLGLSDPLLFMEMAKEWSELGADIIGGCCRIGPDHIKNLSELLVK